MFERVAIATDGSASVERAIAVGTDLADRFDATIHAVYVIDTTEVEAAPADVREPLQAALETHGGEALDSIRERIGADLVSAVRTGKPVAELIGYTREHDIDLLVAGTRGRHGEHRLLMGSVAEGLVRTCPVPVLTVRHLADG